MPTRTKSTPKREPLRVLASVLYVAEESTPWHEKWLARSDSRVNLTLTVRYDVAAKTWTCEPEHCPGFAHHGRCHHCDRCARMRRVRFFSALFAGQPPAVLRQHLVFYETRVAAETANEDDYAARDYLIMRLENSAAA